MRSEAEPGSLTTRLLVSQITVSVIMALSVIIVAATAGPVLFEVHMEQAGEVNPGVLAHAEEAFRTAGFISLAIGLLIATTGSIIVSVLTSRKLRRSLTDLGDVAARISEGDYGLRAAESNSRELATLANSFNTMAARLAATEGTRRRLLTDLAHEIRTPLASIDICVESLEDGAIEPGPEAWGILSSQIDRIARLADDIAQVSAAEEGRLDLVISSVDPQVLAAGAVLAAKDAFERKHVRLDLRPPGDSSAVRVTADAARIGQVLDNLLSNALRHTPSNGAVTLAVTHDDRTVFLEVTDDGEGIAPEHVPHIFERFYRADSARGRDHGGTGVGLAISLAIAKAHHGTLTAVSQGPGLGTTVTLQLPMAAKA
ncbi:MAG: two-component sensor histidine kinase [Actinobacteria bacterium HGW-Actinobacteria-2]|nr:MAG: two-component sensor histidine kinase [Actinobacteria bacterium HGW-Actinobacteria-2]